MMTSMATKLHDRMGHPVYEGKSAHYPQFAFARWYSVRCDKSVIDSRMDLVSMGDEEFHRVYAMYRVEQEDAEQEE